MSAKPPPLASVLFRINNPKITSFYFVFRPVHALTWTSSRFLDPPNVPSSPLAPFLLKRYALHEEVPLWWGSVGQKETGNSKRTVRSWLARRTRNAFTESLRKQGWDAQGRPLSELTKKEALFGTAFLSANGSGLRTPYVELVKQTDVAVQEMQSIVERELGKTSKNNLRGKGRFKAIDKSKNKTLGKSQIEKQ